MASEDISQQEQTRLALVQIYTTARELTRKVDEIVWAVSPRHDSIDSLATYLGRFAQEYLQSVGIRCRLDLPTSVPERTLSSAVRHHLFLACKETLHNVAKHANATEVRLRLQFQAKRLVLTIEDNGRGIKGDTLTMVGAERHSGRKGNGLANIRDRLAELGGQCQFENRLDRGTLVRFILPFHNHGDASSSQRLRRRS
ncbi:MAG TPA: hypothetical protein EYQ50_24705 [Verrucomicrobiales bacterium]|nr:hypothetical protein [Verrucomicrobiales bacterium]